MACLSKREFLKGSLATAVATGAGQSIGADEPKSVFMVLWRGETEVEDGFYAHFAESGMPLNFTVRSLDRDPDRLPDILAEIENVKPDLVYTWGTTVTLGIAGRDPFLASSTQDYPPRVTDRPIVFTMVSQPVKSRIIPAFGVTGRNVTGVSHIVPLNTQFRAMQSYMPIDRVATIYTPTESNSVLVVEQLINLGRRLNIRINDFPVPLDADGNPDPASLPGLVQAAAATGPQFLYLGPDSFIGQYARQITELANLHNLPSFASTEVMLASSDALFGLVAPYEKVGRFTASKVERILFGNESAESIPVEVLPEFSYQIRADVARELEIYPSLSLLDYAEVIGQ